MTAVSARVRTSRRGLALAVAGTLAALSLVAPAQALRSPLASVDPGIAAASGDAVRVVVQAAEGAVDGARRAVAEVGGRLEADLPLVNGFAAKVPAAAIEALRANGSIWAVTLNRVGHLSTVTYDATATASNFVRTSGASTSWGRGDYGRGIGIAVIDTGVSPMADLAGRIVHGPDLSGEGSYIDTHGHGTVMAGAAAGNAHDSGASGYHGVAPEATIVSVKVAGRNGAADVSTMLQAMHWVSAYKSQFNIRVLSLAWGVASTQDPAVDPIDYAVERLWKQGIVVVVAAGNSGPNPGTVTKPGDDPTVITVGAYDDKQNASRTDDEVASWSSRGPTAQGVSKPDLVAPGRYIVASRSFGSQIEADNAPALYAPSYIRGSGTSQATAITAGAVALLLEDNPNWTPDQVKRALRNTARPISGLSANDQGAGRLALDRALDASPGPATQYPSGNGLGSIDASRGGRYVEASCNGVTTVIQGEIDVRCEPWNGSQWTGSQWTGSQWTGSQWTGSQWTGSQWTGSQWTGSQWTGSQWTGSQWTGSSWQGAAWTGSQWTGSQWTGSQWTGSQWTGSQWTGSQWTGSQWTSTPENSWTTVITAAIQRITGASELPSLGSDYAGPGLRVPWGTVFWGSQPQWWQRVAGEISRALVMPAF